MAIRTHLVVHGRVQGVCYRMCARDEAVRLGLTGWVRNTPEGTVEVIAEGRESAVARFVGWCSNGPSYARVTQITENRSQATGEFPTFRITH
ncbi:acylphosphatase [Verrucomicrobiota bacterium]